MTWHLKDRELEKKLEEFSGGNFVNPLNQAIENDGFDSEFVVWVDFGRKFLGDDNKENCLLFRTDELEEVHEYNPKIWNDSRKVKPPENVIFMAKVYRTSLREQTGVYYKALIYKDSKWYYVINGESSDTQMYLYEGDYVEFKAWED